MDLREELLRRRDLDQTWMRQVTGKPVDPVLKEQLERTLRDNADWLRGVIDEWGWPGRSLVGEDGADAAWLLAQHADHDPAFQRECLTLLEAAVAHSEASKRNLAYLTDRVLLREHGTQIYGTQFTLGKYGPEPAPIEDPEGVNERRSQMGLGRLTTYRALMVPMVVVPLARMIALNAWRRCRVIARSLRSRVGRG